MDKRSAIAVVIGASAGGLNAIIKILGPLSGDFPCPILVVQHLHRTDDGFFAEHLNDRCRIPVQEAEDKAAAQPGQVYTAPADYHLLVERDQRLSLSVDPRVRWSRPSIDVLFETAAFVWKENLRAVVLTGANDDGAQGCRWVEKLGGKVLIQKPSTAEQPIMPQAALDATCRSEALPLEEIAAKLGEIKSR